MPGEVEEPNGDATVHHGYAGQDVVGQPVLPRRRKERQGLAGRGTGGQGRHCLVHVFADAGPLAEGGSVVHENPHVEAGRMLSRTSRAADITHKSLRVNRWTVPGAHVSLTVSR